MENLTLARRGDRANGHFTDKRQFFFSFKNFSLVCVSIKIHVKLVLNIKYLRESVPKEKQQQDVNVLMKI